MTGDVGGASLVCMTVEQVVILCLIMLLIGIMLAKGK